MSNSVYRIVSSSKGSGFYDLLENDSLLCTFNRKSFREKLEVLGRGNNWIGSILRLFNKKFPPEVRPADKSSSLRSQLSDVGVSNLCSYLRSKGCKVFRPLPFNDFQVVAFLEENGYSVEGLIEDCYYSTSMMKSVARKVLADE